MFGLTKREQRWAAEQFGQLTALFKDGKFVKNETLVEIRNRLKNY